MAMRAEEEVSKGGEIPVFWILILAFGLYSNILPAWLIIGLGLWYVLLIRLENSGFLEKWSLERVAVSS